MHGIGASVKDPISMCSVYFCNPCNAIKNNSVAQFVMGVPSYGIYVLWLVLLL